MENITASVLLMMFINGKVRPLAHDWYSILKCKENTIHDSREPEIYNN